MRRSVLMRLVGMIVGGLLLASCASKGPAHYYFGDYSEAERLYNKGEYEKAIDKYNAYLQENPEGNLAVIARYYIGKSYAALGDKERAKEVFNKIVAEYPDLVWANFAKNQLKELELEEK